MSKIYRMLASADISHGEDIVTDYLHYGRCVGVQGALDATITEVIGRAHKLIGYIRNAANEQKVITPTFTVAVENSLINVDFLKDRINAITSSRTNADVLKAQSVTRDLS